MNQNFRLEKKEKYDELDLMRLLANLRDFPWYKEAARSYECAKIEFDKCKEHYTRILYDMNKNLAKDEFVFLGISPFSKLGHGYVDHFYYSHKTGYVRNPVFDGMGID